MRKTTPVGVSVVFLLLHIAAIGQNTPRTLLRAGRVLDVKTGGEAAGQTIIVTRDRITAIAPTASTPKQAADTEI